MLRGSGCPACARRRRGAARRKSNQAFVEELSFANPSAEPLEEYRGSYVPMSVRCRTCGTEWTAKPASLLKGVLCPECRHERRASVRRKTNEEFLSDMGKAHPEIDVIGEYAGSKVGVRCRCRVCGHVWSPRPNDLLPYVAQMAVGRRDAVHVFGDDYDTPDGTGVRDYIHVMDLAEGHVAALVWMEGRRGCEVFNLGTGNGTSVHEIIRAFSEACGRDLPYVVEPRRAGDVTANWADCAKAREELGWEARYGIAEMCRDSWNWQSHNPNGYEG